MAPRKNQEEQEHLDEQEEQNGAGSTMIEIFDEEITVTVPRNGNESETLQRVAQLADGL